MVLLKALNVLPPESRLLSLLALRLRAGGADFWPARPIQMAIEENEPCESCG
jgi:hypothetical protein